MKKSLIIITFLFLTSCLNRIETRGYSFELSDYKEIKEGITSKDSVLNFMGYPTFTIYENNDELWIYFAEDIEKFLFFKPTVLKRQIMMLSFNKQEIVEKIHNYDLKDQNNIKFVSDYTDVMTQEKGFFSQLFNNIGQVRPN